jgi:hypothetical protein
MKTILTTLAVLTAVATPVFAQSFDPDLGTGNLQPFAYAPITQQKPVQKMKAAARQSGLRAFAKVGVPSASNPDSPELTGGGSLGYNQMLRTY